MAQTSSPPTTLYLIRHCEPDEPFLDKYYGQLDVPLGEKGRSRSRAVAERLSGIPFEAIYSSDLQRSVYLAEQLGGFLDLPVRQLTVLRERHMGRLQGLTREQLERDHGEIFSQWLADRIHYRLPEGENYIDVGERFVPALLELAATFPGRRVAVVCHAGCIRVALAHALGMPPENIFRFSINHGSIHVISVPDEGPPTVTLMNG